jgi:hypothetical protein
MTRFAFGSPATATSRSWRAGSGAHLTRCACARSSSAFAIRRLGAGGAHGRTRSSATATPAHCPAPRSPGSCLGEATRASPHAPAGSGWSAMPGAGAPRRTAASRSYPGEATPWRTSLSAWAAPPRRSAGAPLGSGSAPRRARQRHVALSGGRARRMSCCACTRRSTQPASPSSSVARIFRCPGACACLGCGPAPDDLRIIRSTIGMEHLPRAREQRQLSRPEGSPARSDRRLNSGLSRSLGEDPARCQRERRVP